jgi:hypothetical protein
VRLFPEHYAKAKFNSPQIKRAVGRNAGMTDKAAESMKLVSVEKSTKY